MTAEEARSISNSLDSNELEEVYQKIKNAAEQNKRQVFVYKPLRATTIERLKSDGFDVTNESSIIIQREEVYHTISW